MNRRDYRAAFDAVDFSADFKERTLQKLAAVRQASEKEQIIMPMNRVKKTALLIAAAVALLAVSVSAAVVWLTPAQVAAELNDPLLAEAFQSDMKISVGLRRETGLHMVKASFRQIPVNDLFNKIFPFFYCLFHLHKGILPFFQLNMFYSTIFFPVVNAELLYEKSP